MDRYPRQSGVEALDPATENDRKGMRVTSLISAGARVRFTHDADRLRISRNAAPNAGERRKFTIQYRGIAPGGLRILKNKFGLLRTCQADPGK